MQSKIFLLRFSSKPLDKRRIITTFQRPAGEGNSSVNNVVFYLQIKQIPIGLL